MNRIKRRWFLALLILLALAGVWRLRFDVEVLNLLPRDLPEVQGLAIYNEHFANARELVVTVRAEDPLAAEAAAEAIAGRLQQDTLRVEEAHWQPPWREHPEQAAAMVAHAWINQPPGEFDRLCERLDRDRLEPELRSARQRLTTTLSPEELARLGLDPLGLTQLPGESGGSVQFGRGDEMFASRDGSFRLVFVQATSDLADYRECALWFESIRKEVQGLESNGVLEGVTVRYTGRPAFVSEISGGMQSDMTRSVIGTALIIAALFFWAHRRWKPMGWLMVLMATAIGLTLAMGGLIYGPLSVVSVGFAAILLGLVVDYGMVLYQEWREHATDEGSSQIGSGRRGVRWSALTTSSAFLMLNLSGLPGLSQLGTLVAIGVSVGAALMLRLYLSPFLKEADAQRTQPPAPSNGRFSQLTQIRPRTAWILTVVFLGIGMAAMWNGPPALNRSADSLRPRSSPAYSALDEIEERMQRNEPSLWWILSAKNVSEAGRMLDESESILESAQAAGSVERFTLPTRIWPRPENVRANRPHLQEMLSRWPDIRQQVLACGFTTNALTLAEGVMEAFRRRLTSTNPWPDNAVARWSLGQFTAQTPSNLFVVGLVYPVEDQDVSLPNMTDRFEGAAWLVGWERLGIALANLVRHDLSHVLIPTVLVIVVCLSFAFRRPSEVLLSLAVLAFSLVTLCGLMKLAGWSWNLLNLMALPLLLGVGVDYCIHTILALRRYQGDLARTRRSVGRALLLCAATTATGFGSLSFSNNAGLASLGQVCAAGVGLSYLVATFLLPGWWFSIHGKAVKPGTTSETGHHGFLPTKPSALYGARGWRLGLWVGRQLPYAALVGLAKLGAACYRRIARHRYDVVTANLHPLCGDDTRTEATADRLFSQFAHKLADLWLYESGGSIKHLFGELRGLEHLLAAQSSGRGLLLVTPHLGNWEFGAPLLTRQGLSMQVVTLTEPDDALTQLRKASRARWNIETVVIGNDPFGFVELIRRLESGATVALLVDRPATTTATTVELFGRPFQASSAAAELARATGCAILPVYVVREDGHYTATALPPIDYERAGLRDPVARHQVTQKILRAFEPAIRQHADQWYHFVPIWPDAATVQDPGADI